jgi:YesN/AraC family two-component response regulator
LLIIDDNADVRTYLADLFKDEFGMHFGENGQEGIDLAVENVPDLIICDVMMPIKTGLELCNVLKSDERTSHIPIILLTAKAGQENEITGLETGAEDYLIKPFNAQVLRAKVDTLLNNRAKTRKYYDHEVQLKPAMFEYNKTEEKFFKKLQHIIDEKLQDPNFHVNDFCKFIGMSRMQLHRKLKATLGVTTSEFIRTERLKAARVLLKKSQLSISEIAYSAGFNDANYFSKSFKKLFKISPQEFKSQSEDS